MSDFETLLAQGKYIDEGMQGLENMMYSKSMNMFQTGETEQFLMSLDESVLRCRQDLKELKVKKQNIMGLSQLINDTEKCIDDLVKFGPLINVQFPGQTYTQYTPRIAPKATVTPTMQFNRERPKTPIQSPAKPATISTSIALQSPRRSPYSQPKFREITHEEYDQCDRLTRLSIHLDDLNSEYRQLYNSGVPQYTEEAAMKITKMFQSKSRAFWSILVKYNRAKEIIDNGTKTYIFT